VNIFVGLITALIHCCLTVPAHAKTFSWLEINGAVMSSYDYNSNIFQTENDKVDDTLIKINPTLQLNTKINRFEISSNYSGEFNRYSTRSDENSNETNFSLNINTNDALQISTYANALYKTAEDLNGNVDDNVQLEEVPNSFDSLNGTVGFKLQNSSKAISIEGSFNYNSKVYQRTELRDRNSDSQAINLINKYIISKRSNFYFLYSQKDIMYTTSGNESSNNVDKQYGIGGEWLATGKLSADMLVSFQNKMPNNSDIDEYGGLAANLNIKWRRRSFSIVDLSLNRTTSENVSKDYLANVNSGLSLSWQHGYASRLAMKSLWSITLTENPAKGESLFAEFSQSFRYTYSTKLSGSILMSYSQRSDTEQVKNSVVVNPKINFNATRHISLSGSVSYEKFYTSEDRIIDTLSTSLSIRLSFD